MAHSSPTQQPPGQFEPSSRTSNAIIREIEQKIAHYAQLVIDLKMERNSHLPIAQLPVEVLCRIFTHMQHLPASSPTKDRRTRRRERALGVTVEKKSNLSWLVVTRICHYWRNAALNEPTLWTKPPLDNPQWTPVFLERSRMAGVTLSFDGESCVHPHQLAPVISHMPHTTTFIARNLSENTLTTLLSHFQSGAASMLQTLTIDGEDRQHQLLGTGQDASASVVVPESVFLGATKLQHLSLRCVAPSWKSHLLSRLTDLKLEKISRSCRPTTTEFLAMLERNASTLRNLTLGDSLPTAQSVLQLSSASHRRQRILLPRLETLDITSDARECDFLYSHIAISDKTHRINTAVPYSGAFDTGGQLFGLLSALDGGTVGQSLGSRSLIALVAGAGRLLRFVTSEKVSTAPFISDDDFATHESLLPSFPPSKSHYSIDDFNLKLEVQPPNTSSHDPPDISIGIVVDFFRALHWDNLTQLVLAELQVNDPGFDAILSKTFGTLPQLRDIVVGPFCAAAVVDALHLNWDQDPQVFPQSLTFPSLEKICFIHVVFDSDDYSKSVYMDRLLDCLMSRYERGAPIHSIAIKDCRWFGDYDWAIALREVVTDVYWHVDQDLYTAMTRRWQAVEDADPASDS